MREWPTGRKLCPGRARLHHRLEAGVSEVRLPASSEDWWADTYPYSNGYCHPDGYTYSYSNTDTNSNPNPYAHAMHGEMYANATAAPYTGTAPVAHDAVIPVYDEAGNVIETHEHTGEFKEP